MAEEGEGRVGGRERLLIWMPGPALESWRRGLREEAVPRKGRKVRKGEAPGSRL